VNNLNNISDITPLIICGNARSGTRMMTDIANSHSNIVIQEEMHAKTIEAYFNLVENVNKNFEHYSDRKGYKLSNHWENSQKSLTISFLSFANKKPMVGYDKNVKYYGIKTPGFERYYNQFESVFNGQAKYIYCLRNPASVWRSWKSLDFVDDIEIFKARYTRSLRQAVKIKNNSPQRFALFNLDEYISSPDKTHYVSNTVLSSIGISEEFNAGTIESLENRNSMQKRGSKPNEGSKFNEEKQYLEEDIAILKYRNMLITDE
jgi:hypothetical protein